MEFALQKNLPLIFTTKNTILKAYDGAFMDIVSQIYESHYKEKFIKKGIYYQHRLIDDMVAYVIKSDGGFIWASKNYDGDVESRLIGYGTGSYDFLNSYILFNDCQVSTLVLKNNEEQSIKFIKTLNLYLKALLRTNEDE